MAKFTHSKPTKGNQVIGKYVFTDGIMEVSDEDAKLIAPILCRFHACKLEFSPVVVQEEEQLDEPSLASSITKGDKK